jgi:hypothetical protein
MSPLLATLILSFKDVLPDGVVWKDRYAGVLDDVQAAPSENDCMDAPDTNVVPVL